MTSQAVPGWVAPLLVGALLAVGVYGVAVADEFAARLATARSTGLRAVAGAPLRRAAWLLCQQVAQTERPDTATWLLAPAAYLGLAAAALTVVPLAEGVTVADFSTGIVVWGAAEALAIIAIFLFGWSPNSFFPLLAGYRFVAMALSYELISMFVLIAVAVPAESLQISAIVADQQDLWNVARQPLGLPLFLVVALGVSFWGPLNLAGGMDAAGGVTAEASGLRRLVWAAGRAAMLVTFAAMAAAAFLGGWWGPVLPGWAWMALKTAAVVAILVAAGHLLGQVRPERIVTLLWTVLLPVAFVDLAVAGLGALP